MKFKTVNNFKYLGVNYSYQQNEDKIEKKNGLYQLHSYSIIHVLYVDMKISNLTEKFLYSDFKIHRVKKNRMGHRVTSEQELNKTNN